MSCLNAHLRMDAQLKELPLLTPPQMEVALRREIGWTLR